METYQGLIDYLRDHQRLKYNCDYAITYKYNEFHLLCNEVFEEEIRQIALDFFGITFKTTHIYGN